eukprot:5098665-Amphidinium_carterae.1
MCVYPTGGLPPVMIQPLSGRVAMFYADVMPHEVMPTFRTRYSINVWYYDIDERDRAIKDATDRGRLGGHGGQ